MTTSRVNGPITVAIVDDYDVVVMANGHARVAMRSPSAGGSPSK